MLGQRRRRWVNINPTLGQRLVFVWTGLGCGSPDLPRIVKRSSLASDQGNKGFKLCFTYAPIFMTVVEQRRYIT